MLHLLVSMFAQNWDSGFSEDMNTRRIAELFPSFLQTWSTEVNMHQGLLTLSEYLRGGKQE